MEDNRDSLGRRNPGATSSIDKADPAVRESVLSLITADDPGSWQDIADAIAVEHGVRLSSDAVKRWARANGLQRKVVVLPVATFALQAAEPESAETHLRDRVSFLEGELKAAGTVISQLRSKTAATDRLAEVVAEVVADTAQVRPRLAPVMKAKVGDYTPQYMLAHISDAHYGEMVDPALALGISYSPEVCRERLTRLRDAIISHRDHSRIPVAVLHLAFLGDMLSGIIHADLEVTNASGMSDQMVEMSYLLTQFTLDLAEVFPSVEAVVMTGNHPRFHQKPRFKGRQENWEYLMGKMMEALLGKQDRVKITVPRAAIHVHEVDRWRIALTHGDGVRAQSFAGIPFYSTKQRRDALQALFRTLGIPQVDQLSMGHFHQHIHWPADCGVVINGSIKGGDEMGISERYAAIPPLQLVQRWHPTRGLTGSEYITF